MNATPTAPLLEAKSILKVYPGRRSLFGRSGLGLRAVDDVSLEVHAGETVGIVGESGCGKSTLGRCLLRLVDISGGTLRFNGIDISLASQRSLRSLRRQMQMVFQDPMGSLNPRRRVGQILADPFSIHTDLPARAVRERVAELLADVELRPEHAMRFPHELSGGQRQRVGIARALALRPQLIVADEPVSALDVSIQAQIVNLMAALREKHALTYVFIAHDLAVVRQISTRLVVMYLGSIVETGAVADVLAEPRHPYTLALRSAVPVPVPGRKTGLNGLIRGDLQSRISVPPGCKFHPRCPAAQEKCRLERPTLTDCGGGRSVACHFPIAWAVARGAIAGVGASARG